jgi:hypothetical protein
MGGYHNEDAIEIDSESNGIRTLMVARLALAELALPRTSAS